VVRGASNSKHIIWRKPVTYGIYVCMMLEAIFVIWSNIMLKVTS
jgi:hypothetical protein